MYVALSQARSLEGLKAEALGPDMDCDEQIRRFWMEHFGRSKIPGAASHSLALPPRLRPQP